MNFYSNWYKEHKGYDIRPYADRILNIELPKSFIKNNVAILAAAPNSGKTLLSIAFIEKYLIDNPYHRVLVLTHGQSLLRNQFYKDIKEAKTKFTFSKVSKKEDFNTKKQVVVTLPQTIINSIDDDLSTFDLLVVDEAHHYYTVADGMIERIIEKYNFKKQLLLTGTPAPFVALKMNIIAVSLEELIENGYASDPIIVISKSTYKINKDDFTPNDELKQTVKLNEKETIETLDELLKVIETKTKTIGWIDTINEMKKSLIVAKNITQANHIKKYFNNHKIESLVSTSDNDLESENVKKFIKTDIKILIVVNRAVLGFNLPELVNVIDMKCGKNISNQFQLLNRITRLHPDNLQKYFFKVVPESHEEDYLYMLSAAISLMFKENYIKYNGTPDELVIPVIKTDIKKEYVGKIRNKSKWKYEPIKYIDVPVHKMWKQTDVNFQWTKLNIVINSNENIRKWSLYEEEENYQYCLETVKKYFNIN